MIFIIGKVHHLINFERYCPKYYFQIDVDSIASLSLTQYLRMSQNMDQITFEVDGILEKRVTKEGINEYKILWKDYKKQQATWEPAWTLTTISALLDQFEHQTQSERKATIDRIFKERLKKKNNGKKRSKSQQLAQKKKRKLHLKPILKNENKNQIYQQTQDQDQDQEQVQDQEQEQKEEQEQEYRPSNKSKQGAQKRVSSKQTGKNESKSSHHSVKQQQKLKKNGILRVSEYQEVELSTNEPETVEVLKIVFKGADNKRVYQVRVNSTIVELDSQQLKNLYPRELCTFYQRILRFDP